jgi:predicted DNA-binding transcriptional regulator AlpA
MASELLTLAEVGARLRLSRTSVWRMVRDGKLRTVHPVPGAPRVKEREVERLIRDLAE